MRDDLVGSLNEYVMHTKGKKEKKKSEIIRYE